MNYDLLYEIEDKCKKEALSDDKVSTELRAAQILFDALVDHLYRFSSCHWGCHEKEHVLEYLGGRTVSSLLSAKRLNETGYYDEALTLVRNVGEIANLLNLFWSNVDLMRDWIDSAERVRRREFRPAAVRKKLLAAKVLIPFSDAHYSRLCELVHVGPATRPQSHNSKREPTLGAVYRRDEYMIGQWEIIWAICAVSGPIAKLAIFPREEAKRMVEMTIDLAELVFIHHPQMENT